MPDFSYEIFKYLKPEGNDIISEYKEHDLQEILYYIDKYFLEYRNSLGFSSDVTFGVEVEADCDDCVPIITQDVLDLNLTNNWEIVPEKSITNGIEARGAILKDSKSDWEDLKKICLAISKHGYINNDCGGHVHLGAHIIGDSKESWLNFIRLWSAYENVIYRFCYGEYLSQRSRILGFAKPMASTFLEDINKIIDEDKNVIDLITQVCHGTKGQSVNFKNVITPSTFGKKNTIEFRCPNGSLNPIIWQNNINLFVHLLEYAKSDRFNNDIISKRCSEVSESSLKLRLYGKMFSNLY